MKFIKKIEVRIFNIVINIKCIEEQIERTELFYVLEQFFSKVKENPDPMNKA